MVQTVSVSGLLILVVLVVAGLAVVGGVSALVVLAASKRQGGSANPNLFSCPDCGCYVSRLAASCPNCGRPLASKG